MNQSLLNLELHSFNDIDLFEKYEICRQQSQCYLLIPPPRPPILPKLILTNPSSTLNYLHPRTDAFFFIIFGTFITLISTCCLLLFLLGVKFQLYHKLRQWYRRRKDTIITDATSSCSSIIPTSYTSLTPLTTITNQSPSLTMINQSNLIFQPHLTPTDRLIYHNHSINIYEEIRLSSNYPHCLHSLRYDQQNHPLRSYYTLSPSKIVCQNCLLETLHRKQQCLCQNFFVPIK